MTFADLDRSFIRIEKDKEPDLSVGRVWGRKIGGWLQWSEILDRRRVVLLAEASSGKTEEFRNKAGALRTKGQAAFFVAIEGLADFGLEMALGPDETALFEQWRNGAEDGFFFLDSVDEARLNRKSFEGALKRFARELGASLDRTHVFVSCRVSDWKEPGDRRSIETLLPLPREPAAAEAPENSDGALLNPIFDKESQTKESTTEDEQPNVDELLVVQLVPLSDEQRLTLATASGVEDSGAFVTAINRQGLDSLAERPGDLLDLAEYWKSYDRFGTFAEMTEHGISRKLTERDKFRPDNEALTAQQARQGAERVAATLTLGKSFTLRAPGHDPDPTLAAGALEPVSILDDWTDAKRNALMRRGVFAPATYGRIRFHHRSTQEYLTAAWFDLLLRKNCPRAEILNLLFADRYGVETIVPSLRPATAWLALRHADIQEEIVKREPLVLLRHGDPGSLPVETKCRLLITYATKHLAGEIADDSLDHRSLWMFADTGLSDVIRDAWHLNNRDDFRTDLLRLIREGGIAECVDLAEEVVRDKTADDYFRIVALQAMEECGDHGRLEEVVQQLMSDPAQASSPIAEGFGRILFPHHLSVGQLLDLIDKSQPARSDTAGGFGYGISDIWDACPTEEARNEFAAGLAELCLRPPLIDDYQRISNRHQELAKHLGPIARSMVIELGDRDLTESLVRLLMVVERAERGYSSKNDEPQLNVLVRDNAKLHRALFWRDVEDRRQHKGKDKEPTRFWQIYFGGEPLWKLAAPDLPWIYDDLDHSARDGDRRIALSAIVSILDHEDLLHDEIESLRAQISNNTVLNEDLDGYLAPKEEDDATRRLEKRNQKVKQERAEQEEHDKASWVRFRDDLQADPSQLSDSLQLIEWAGVSKLLSLTRWLCRKTKQNEEGAAPQWRLLEEGFGSAVAEAYHDGMKVLWRVVEPERPRREKGSRITVKWTTVLSFAGLAIEAADDPGWGSSLTAEEAQRGARHGLMAERGYPEWIDTLALAHPDVVLPVIRAAINTEWLSKIEGRSDFLHHYSVPTHPLHPLIESEVYNIITRRSPKLLRKLDLGLRILQRMNLGGDRQQALSKLALRRFRKSLAGHDHGWALRYLALLFLTDPPRAVDMLVAWIRDTNTKDRKALAESAFGALFGRHDPLISVALEGIPLPALEEFLLLVYQQVRPDEDIVHEGADTPGARDEAESSRNAVLSALVDSSGADAYMVMRRLADHPDMQSRAHRFLELARGMAERDTEIPAWTVPDILALERQYTTPVKTGPDLFRVVLSTLDDVRFSFDNADATSRRVLETATDEDAVQNWLAEQLILRANDRFHVHREAEVADKNLPDVLVSSASASCEVAIEVKHGGMGWTVRKLEKALRNQLAENYLRPASRRHGVFLITYHGKRTWRHPATKKTLTFTDLIAHLTNIASALLRNKTGPIEVTVVGINASATATGSLA